MPPSLYILLFCVINLYVDASKTLPSENKGLCSYGSKKVKCIHGSCINDSESETPICLCDRGWSGTTCESCGGRLRLAAETTPGYIVDAYHNYSLDTKCTWLIEGKPGTPIQLSFEHFATECSWDHLYVYDGDSVYSTLIAAFSGLMLTDKNTFSTKKELPSLTVRSGSAYLHFYSDAAYNMSGFNISYRTNNCPKNCSGNGKCDPGRGWTCDCNSAWTGDACNKPKCPNNCSGHGICESRGEPSGKKCYCYKRYSGIDCSIPEERGKWEEVKYSLNYTYNTYDTTIYDENNGLPPGRASHKSVLVDNDIWIVGGYDFNVQEEVNVLRYDVISDIMHFVEIPVKLEKPRRRYGHSLVAYEEKLFMFGGVIDNTITNELWFFDITDKRWYKVDPMFNSNSHPKSVYYAVVGHTAHLINGIMYVVFGHSPIYGYVNTIQECNMSNYVWSIKNSTGAIVKGGYGHTSVYDPDTNRIYVHGGYQSGSTSAYHLSHSLYSYDPHRRIWYILHNSKNIAHPQYLHTSVITDGLMLVYGGNTHNDTATSRGAKCYSSTFMAYDIGCDKWYKLAEPLLDRDIARFGHTADMYSYKHSKTNTVSHYMYIFGGFNGQMMNDIFKYTPGNCQANDNKEACLSAHEGVVCVWVDNIHCLKKSDAILRKSRKSASSFEERSCPTHSRGDDDRECKLANSCPSCVETSYNCVWCENHCKESAKCEKKLKAYDLNTCMANFSQYSSVCPTLHNCYACVSDGRCDWDNRNKICEYSTKKSTNQVDSVEDRCKSPCYTYGTCENCTSNACMWCSNQVRCVEPNAYVASFPYGQCMEWTTNEMKCPVTRCSQLRTCDECQQNPSCGWCDDGSDTGLGHCMEGSKPGSLNTTTNNTCPKNRWYFVDCPLCQCNGHSKCANNTDICLACEHETTGPQCQKCRHGYFGRPTNGRTCAACQCNDQADNCNHENGSCFCRTRGVIGDKCDVCDKSHKYFGSPRDGGTCFYELATDYQFTFNLSKPEDEYYTQINFLNIPLKEDRDVDFQINCSYSAAKMNVSIRLDNMSEEVIHAELPCSVFKDKFSHKEYPFGKEHNATFYVYVYGFRTPFWLQISFSQFPQIDLLRFFITFISCFLSLLLVAVIMWKLKQKYDLYRRTQRMRVEREQWANRPFGTSMIVSDDSPEAQEMMLVAPKKELTESNTKHSVRSKTKSIQNPFSQKKPGCIAIEPLHSNKTAVVTVIIKLPTGDEDWPPPGHCGISLGTSLVTLGNSQRTLLEQTKTDKTAGKVQIQNNCPTEYIV